MSSHSDILDEGKKIGLLQVTSIKNWYRGSTIVGGLALFLINLRILTIIVEIIFSFPIFIYFNNSGIGEFFGDIARIIFSDTMNPLIYIELGILLVFSLFFFIYSLIYVRILFYLKRHLKDKHLLHQRLLKNQKSSALRITGIIALIAIIFVTVKTGDSILFLIFILPILANIQFFVTLNMFRTLNSTYQK